ncbi:hypothetical protein DAPPUDRAFT_115856 [Daphnia pulex]|uniref:Uncharacterized protein n=1 Tax=Daphnia pulex TaxID=6669 RepID=E9HMS8_DAPPU|nr:hypothetical protein DAPPUDRAFT_115856 [Daphnia pulex]|eukprot:EFX66959.1 hypothetical protein DAPPUDRAFT_115856 [Daphnia pulex]
MKVKNSEIIRFFNFTESDRQGVFNCYITYIRNRQFIFQLIHGEKKKDAINETYIEFASRLYESGIIPDFNGVLLQPRCSDIYPNYVVLLLASPVHSSHSFDKKMWKTPKITKVQMRRKFQTVEKEVEGTVLTLKELDLYTCFHQEIYEVIHRHIYSVSGISCVLGKGKPRYNVKRLQHRPHTPKPAVFNSEHLTTEAKEKICELEEEQRFQDYLAKEAAANAASAREQTQVFYQLSNLARKQVEIDREKLELAHKYNDSLESIAASSSVAVNTVLITPPITPAKGRTDHFRRLFGLKGSEEVQEESVQK